MDLSSLSAIAPGFIQGQQNALALKRKQEEQVAIERQKTADTILAGSLMGDLGSLSPAPPGGPAPVPQGAGQPSVPAGGPKPDQSLGGVAQPTPPGAPPPGYPMQQAQPRPQMAAMPQGQPGQAGPQPGPAGGAPQGAGGMMSLEQMAQHIMAAPGNRGIDWRKPQNAQALLMALEKNQQLLAPQAKAELAQAKQELAVQALMSKIEMANKTLELKQLSEQDRTRGLQEANALKLQIAQITDSRSRDKLDAMLGIALQKLTQGDRKLDQGDRALDIREQTSANALAVKKELGDAKNLTTAQIGSTNWYRQRQIELKEKQLSDAAVKVQLDHEVKLLQEEGRNNRTTQVEAGKTAALTEKGREADQAEGGRNARAKATLEKAGSTVFSDETAQFLAESMRTDPSIISHIGSGQSANANKQKILAAYAKLPGVDPGSLAEARVALQSNSSEARKVGTQAGSVLLGTKEIEEFAPLVLSAAKKVDATKYPSLNAMNQAVQKGTGEPEIVTLVNNIQALKSAYTQILTRGGVPGVEAQKRADELISPTMAPAQIEAAVAAMKAEGAGAGRAATKAGKVVSEKAAGRETAPAADAPEEADPFGVFK